MKFRALLAAFAAVGAGIWAAEQKPVVQPQRPAMQPAQQPVVQADEPTRIQVDVTRVSLLYTVTDRKGRFVTNLTKDDFEVIDSKKPQNILEFNAESDLPARHCGGERWRRQPEPVHARPGARNGAEGRRRALRNLHQHQQD